MHPDQHFELAKLRQEELSRIRYHHFSSDIVERPKRLTRLRASARSSVAKLGLHASRRGRVANRKSPA